MLGMAKKPANPWAKKLRQAREARGLTQTQAAALLGVTQRSWAMWEAGRQPSKPLKLLLQLFIDGKI
jgi:transcriptional regulator with XRE-family HTH domain